jgi:hypothetical protein
LLLLLLLRRLLVILTLKRVLLLLLQHGRLQGEEQVLKCDTSHWPSCYCCCSMLAMGWGEACRSS